MGIPNITITKRNYDNTAKHLKEYQLRLKSSSESTDSVLLYSNRMEQTQSTIILKQTNNENGWEYLMFDTIESTPEDERLVEAEKRLKKRALEQAGWELIIRTPIIEDLTQDIK